ncbi:MAG: TRAP transporter small permease subunit [Pseudomonadota bacterium]|nr:TRAP transporter small permease subunit [Pseudomonadota bacterium]
MIDTLRKAQRGLDGINAWIGPAIAWFTLATVVVTFLVVVLRYGFDLGWIAMQESVTYLHATVFMVGAAYTLQRDAHVRVDIFYRKFGPRGRAWVDLLGTVLFLFPLCVFLIWSSWDYVRVSWLLQEGSREAGGLPGVYLLKTLIPLMSVLLIVQGLAILAGSLVTIASREKKGA